MEHAIAPCRASKFAVSVCLVVHEFEIGDNEPANTSTSSEGWFHG